MENYLYKCHYCGVEYVPRRRRKQKFCSNSCRVTSHNFKKGKKKITGLSVPSESKSVDEQLSLAGIGNAAIGTAAVEIGKSLFTPTNNKPATKGDVQAILNKLGQSSQRYLPLKNGTPDYDGELPVYDTETQNALYPKNITKWK